jgi:uncharacterized protein
MSVTGALVLTVLVLVAVNVWVHVGPERWQPVTGPAVAVLLLLIGRWAGLSWAELGLGRAAVLSGLLWGGAAAALVAVVYGVGVSVPASRRRFLDARHRVGPARAARRALLLVPLGVVVFEEVAFRGVLWGLVEEGRGPLVAAAATSVLFGVWHVLPAVDGARANAGEGHRARPAVLIRQVAGTVAFTTLAGIVFAVLRQQSGSLLAPFLLHWATNGLGILAAAWAWTTQRD